MAIRVEQLLEWWAEAQRRREWPLPVVVVTVEDQDAPRSHYVRMAGEGSPRIQVAAYQAETRSLYGLAPADELATWCEAQLMLAGLGPPAGE